MKSFLNRKTKNTSLFRVLNAKFGSVWSNSRLDCFTVGLACWRRFGDWGAFLWWSSESGSDGGCLADVTDEVVTSPEGHGVPVRYPPPEIKREQQPLNQIPRNCNLVNNQSLLTYLQLSSGMSHGFQQVDMVRNMNENAIVKTILTNQVAFWKW